MLDTTYGGDERDSGQEPAQGHMQEHTHEDGERAGARIQAPATLLPSILHQLGLANEPVAESSEIAVDDVVMNLRSEDWQTRIAAVRTLGKLGEHVPVELLNGALEDEDSSVRAAAVHVLGCAGKRAPLPRLVTALHDTDWHVRETAVLVLSNWRQDVPAEELNSALYDEDGLVRQAAQFALHDNDEQITTDTYGRLWEQKSMQQRQEPPLQKGEGNDPFETLFDARKQDEGDYPEYTHTLHEQAQEYAPREPFSYEHSAPMSEQWEKVTSLPARRSQKGWWAIVAGTAIVFFLLGSGMTRMMEPVGAFPFAMNRGIPNKEMPRPADGFNFADSSYTLIIQNEVSSALKMSPDAIRGSLKEGKQLSDIAAQQGISEDQLRKIELQALTDASNAALKPDSEQAQRLIGQLRANPQAMDKIVTSVFLSNQAGPGA